MSGKKQEFNKSIIEKEESFFASLIQYAFVILVALTVAVILRTQVSMVRSVDGVSMQPTYNSVARGYESGTYDTVRITRLGVVRRGDVVTFVSNMPLEYKNGKAVQYKILIKRVIGVGGDKLRFEDGGSGVLEVYRNDKKLDEPYIKRNGNGIPEFHYGINGPWRWKLGEEINVPKNCYFVMGDNRDNSTDSRSNKKTLGRYDVGFVPRDKVEGKVYLSVYNGQTYIGALWKKVFG